MLRNSKIKSFLKIVTIAFCIFVAMSSASCSNQSASSKLNGAPSSQKENASEQEQSSSFKTTPTGRTTTVDEKIYVPMVNEIYTNPSEYLGDKIVIKGMFLSHVYDGKTYNFVYRVGPGCCGNDGDICGFEVIFKTNNLPKQNEWISVEGLLQGFMEDGQPYIRIEDASYEKVSPGKVNVYHNN